jgi:hypothetical protein
MGVPKESCEFNGDKITLTRLKFAKLPTKDTTRGYHQSVWCHFGQPSIDTKPEKIKIIIRDTSEYSSNKKNSLANFLFEE